MPGLEAHESSFSTRGNDIWRRYGRTIIGRPNSAPRPIPLSRTERQGLLSGIAPEEERQPSLVDPQALAEELRERAAESQFGLRELGEEE